MCDRKSLRGCIRPRHILCFNVEYLKMCENINTLISCGNLANSPCGTRNPGIARQTKNQMIFLDMHIFPGDLVLVLVLVNRHLFTSS